MREIRGSTVKSGKRLQLSLSGQGDPWSSKHYRSLLKYMAQHDLDLQLSLRTNGLLMTRARWTEYSGLEKYRPLLDVSIDACRPWSFAVVRRNGDWNKLEENLYFMAEKHKEGVFSEFYINATVQLDNFHELAEMVRLGKKLGCTGVRFYMIQNTGDHVAADYPKKNVADPEHPLHAAFLETLRDPIFDDPICQLYDLETMRKKSFATKLECDGATFESPEACAEIAQSYLDADDPSKAVEVASHGRRVFGLCPALLIQEASGIEGLGFSGPALYRYHELSQASPDDVQAMVALGTALVESGDIKAGVRKLVDAVAASERPELHDLVAGYITDLVKPRRVALPMQR
ncbi:MAG TPA: hypothetical protein VJT73_18645 [Polyangiaceae bacterium]|nr:hypothetical protein [Polyangiaceae bacterium]